MGVCGGQGAGGNAFRKGVDKMCRTVNWLGKAFGRPKGPRVMNASKATVLSWASDPRNRSREIGAPKRSSYVPTGGPPITVLGSTARLRTSFLDMYALLGPIFWLTLQSI